MATIETVTIPKEIWDDALKDRPWLFRLVAEKYAVVSEGTVEQLSFPIKAGVTIAVAIVAYLLLRKALKV